jgi:arabinofuranosyltransferase
MTSAVAQSRNARLDHALVAALLATLVLLVVKCAWVCDDAYISFRVVENALAGYGLRWNIDERVQAYTHPAWLGLMLAARAISGEVYLTSIALGAATTLAAAVLLVGRVARDAYAAAFALCIWCGSKAFIDFSTSGLENPLLHVALLGALLAVAEERPPLVIGLWTSVAALTRLDSLALLAPLVLLGLGELQPRRLATFALGLAPLAAWELFSLVYYGALTPNTAIAKLNTGLDGFELAAQGLRYLADSLSRDPLTLAAIVAGAALSVASRARLGYAIALGLALHLAYVVKIGGDFMSGRFLTAPLCVATFALAHLPCPPRALGLGAFAALLLAVATPSSPLRAPLDYAQGKLPPAHIGPDGIADERAYWYSAAGLFAPTRAMEPPPYRHVSRGHGPGLKMRDTRDAKAVEGIGYIGYWAGPKPHLIDPMGLSDGFLARLPIVVDGRVVRPDKNRFGEREWRVGHYYRDVPPAYLAALRGEAAQFDNAELERLHTDVQLITRGELFDSERWAAIARRLR